MPGIPPTFKIEEGNRKRGACFVWNMVLKPGFDGNGGKGN